MINFSKEIITDYAINKYDKLDSGILYQLFNKDQLSGQLILSKTYSFFRANLKEFVIHNNGTIIDELNFQTVGQYKYSNWTIFTGYRDELIWNNNEYQLKKVKPNIRYSIFDKDTWGHFKFQLSNGSEEVVYTFKIDIPSVSMGNLFLNKSFNGQIQIEGVDTIVALAGLKLIEKALENESLLAE